MYYEKSADGKGYYRFYREQISESTEPRFTPPHCHSALELLVVTDGYTEAIVNGESRTLTAGSIIFLDSCDIHSFTCNDCERYSLIFSKEYCRTFLEDGRTLPNFPACDERRFAAISARLSEYYELYGTVIPNKPLVESLVSYILGMLEFCNEKQPGSDKSKELMIGVMEYIGEHADSDLTLPEVAAHFGYTTNYFSSLFNKFFQMSFSDYLNYVRYTRAKEIILLEGCTATDIAMMCGFGSMKSFYRAKSKFDKKI